MTIAILGIDLGKTVCSLVGLDDAGAVVLRRRMRRTTVIAYAAKLPACIVAMEACCGAHLLGRLLADQGHTVRLMSPEYVRPYVKAQKNDDRDAEAIAEAASRPTMRFVELKSEAQLEMQTLHRVRSRLVGARRTLLNQASGDSVRARTRLRSRAARPRTGGRCDAGRPRGGAEPAFAGVGHRDPGRMARPRPPH